ncbi:hypothetical protein [Nonomuraea sp. NPDC050643]|uniref:hypothetical protein n=1 Tax=Nonomuraea sp. NPDC050643 TaxID=3155660 RepID=UPI0033EE7C15
MRFSVTLWAPLLLSLAACAPAPAITPTASPGTSEARTPEARTPEARTPEPTARESRRPAMAGPGTVCGEVQPQPPGAPMAVVAVHKGRADCAQALRVFRAYHRPQTPRQGTAGIATVAGWECAGNTAAESMRTGRLTSCRKDGTTIVADVIP